jgi:hypothetical protein
VKDEVWRIFIGRNWSEVFAREEIDLIKKFFEVSVKGPVAIEYKLGGY